MRGRMLLHVCSHTRAQIALPCYHCHATGTSSTTLRSHPAWRTSQVWISLCFAFSAAMSRTVVWIMHMPAAVMCHVIACLECSCLRSSHPCAHRNGHIHARCDRRAQAQVTMHCCTPAVHAGVGKMCWLLDFEGYSLANAPPLRVSIYCNSVLQNHYPERLGLAVCYHAPTLFSMTWRVRRGWGSGGHSLHCVGVALAYDCWVLTPCPHACLNCVFVLVGRVGLAPSPVLWIACTV